MENIKDTLELYALTDQFSIFADQKKFKELVELCTDDIIFRGLDNGKLVSELKGKAEIKSTFDRFANQFSVLFHMNGEKLFDIDGQYASGTTYCQVDILSSDFAFRERWDITSDSTGDYI